MKLLRFTSSDPTGIFNSYLNQELQIPPQSQIALGSVALEIDAKVLIVDATNSVVTFQCSTGQLRTFRLAHGTYDSSNFQDFVNDFINKMNSVLGTITAANRLASPAEIGKQGLLKKGQDGKIQIKLNMVNAQPFGNNITTDAPLKDLGAGAVRCVTSTNPQNLRTIIQRNSATGNANFAATTAQRIPISSGCGIHRARLETLTNNGGGGAGGLGATISLHKAIAKNGTGNPLTYIDSRDMVIADINFGIQAIASYGGAGGAQNGTYSFIIDGVSTNTAIQISATGAPNTHDVMSLEVCAGQVRGVVYKNDPPNAAPSVNVLFTQAIPPDPNANPPSTTPNFSDAFGELSASYTLHGAGTSAPIGCRLGFLRYTPDPYLAESQEGFDDSAFDFDEGIGDAPLQASTPQGQSPSLTNHDIRFTGTEISSWLGYLQQRQPSNDPTGFLRARKIAIFEAQSIFQSLVVNDCFMIEMLNLSIESYDFFEEQRKRKNLLAVLPFDDANGKCIFQPSNQNFLDLNNQHTIRLNEVKLRIIRKDYTEVQLTGLSSVVIFLKEKAEK